MDLTSQSPGNARALGLTLNPLQWQCHNALSFKSTRDPRCAVLLCVVDMRIISPLCMSDVTPTIAPCANAILPPSGSDQGQTLKAQASCCPPFPNQASTEGLESNSPRVFNLPPLLVAALLNGYLRYRPLWACTLFFLHFQTLSRSSAPNLTD